MIARQQTYSGGDVLGVTQALSPAMRRLFRAIHLRADVIVYLQQLLSDQLLCRVDVKQVSFDWSQNKFPDNTVFEDDAIERIAKLIGCNYYEADMWRRAFAKRTKRKLWSPHTVLGLNLKKEEIVEDPKAVKWLWYL